MSLQNNAPFNYGEALEKSFLFYEAQRSGQLPEDNRIEWRGDSALNDGADVGLDLTGGYYDAGDHVKFGLPMASTMTTIAWGIDEFKDGYSQTGQLDEALDAIKWGTDYLLKAHVISDGKTQQFVAQVGDGNIDHAYWGSPEEMNVERPTFIIDPNRPGSDVAAESAAALASASIIFESIDPDYANTLEYNAKLLFDFAETYQGRYSDSVTNARAFYASEGYYDELSWGAMWLYKATGEQKYLDTAKEYSVQYLGDYTHMWNDKTYGTQVLLAEETGEQRYIQEVEKWLDMWVNGTGPVTKTEGGLAWRWEWGSLGLAANTAFVAGVYNKNVNNSDRYRQFAEEQINYILGANPLGFSYQVGFGDNYPEQPHHRGAHGREDANDNFDNEHDIEGAIVGGLTSPDDYNYQDSRIDWIGNEVALDYNAGFTGALAYLSEVYSLDLPNEPIQPQASSNREPEPIQPVAASNQPPQLITSNDRNIISGTSRNDTIYGQGENENIRGRGGNDSLYGGDGNDLLQGQKNEDTLYGENGDDRLIGGGNNDRLFGGEGNDTLKGNNGRDLLSGGNGRDVLQGQIGNDTLLGSGININDRVANDDLLYGGAGNDTFDLKQYSKHLIDNGRSNVEAQNTVFDRAVIKDFNVREDSLVVGQSESSYLVYNTIQIDNGTGIVAEYPDNNKQYLLGLIENVDKNTFDSEVEIVYETV